MMDKKKFIANFEKALSMLMLPYYNKKLLQINYVVDSSFSIYLKFILPHASIKELWEFCAVNNYCMSFSGGDAEISGYHPFNQDKMYVPQKITLT